MRSCAGNLRGPYRRLNGKNGSWKMGDRRWEKRLQRYLLILLRRFAIKRGLASETHLHGVLLSVGEGLGEPVFDEGFSLLASRLANEVDVRFGALDRKICNRALQVVHCLARAAQVAVLFHFIRYQRGVDGGFVKVNIRRNHVNNSVLQFEIPPGIEVNVIGISD